MDKFYGFLSLVGSYIIAIIRLFFWMGVLLVSGLQQILFTRTEICYIELKGLPLRCDRDDIIDKISYVDKLKVENPDLEIVDEEDGNNSDDTNEGE